MDIYIFNKAQKLYNELEKVGRDLSLWTYHIQEPLQLRCGQAGIVLEMEVIPDKKSFDIFRESRIIDLERQKKELQRKIEKL